MKTWLTPFIALSLAVSAPASALASELTELAERTKPAVVLLTIEDAGGRKLGTGTGFFVSPEGRIVTNHHVIAHGAKITATLSDGSKRAVLGVLASDEDKDIAILKAEGSAFPALPLGDSSGVKPGDEVVVIGSPKGLSGTLTVGIVSALRARGLVDDDDDEVRDRAKTRFWGLQISAPISPGSSGSPIMTRTGEVIAVAVGSRLGAQSLNFGVPIEIAKGMLSTLGPDAEVSPLGSKVLDSKERQEVLRNLLISAAAFGALALAYFLWGRYEVFRDRRAGSYRRSRERR